MTWPWAFVIVGGLWAAAWVLVVIVRNVDHFADDR